MKKLSALIGGLLLVGSLNAQSVPTPGPAQAVPIFLQNATVHYGNGKVETNANILIAEGKIVAAGIAKIDPGSAEVIDLSGKHVYPGLIAPVSNLGLVEIDAVRSTHDNAEAGTINPNARAIISYNTDSRVTPTVRSNGVLLAQIMPSGGLISGLSSVVQLDAWNWEDAAYNLDDGMRLNWPSQRIQTASWAPPREEQLKKIKENLEKVDKTFRNALAYRSAKEAGKIEKTDQRWEAMLPFLKGEKQIYLFADSEQDIRSALEFTRRYDLKIVLVGGDDAWRLIGMLKAMNVPVILSKPHSLPRTEDDGIDIPFKTAMMLHEAGILTCLSIDNFWNYRNLPFQAGQLVAMGMDKEVALQLITSNTAQILGIEKRTGTIAEGMDANIIVSTGDLLDMRSSNIEMALIQGRKMDLGNKQKDLYKKFGGE